MVPYRALIVLCLYVTSVLFLVIITLSQSVWPRAAFNPSPLPEKKVSKTRDATNPALPQEDQTDRKTQPTYNPVPQSENKKGSEKQNTHTPTPLQKDLTESETQYSLTEALYRRLVVLTAFSSDHCREALDMIGSVQKYLPHAKIIVYDIGLTKEERENATQFCNVELRYFNFNKYPSHVKMNLYNYAWKPLILQELVEETHDVILYGDASLHMKSYYIDMALHCLHQFLFLNIKSERHLAISVTHNKMIRYFHFPPSREYMAQWKTIQSGGWFILVNDLTREKLIAPWVDCALHVECIAPEGATLGPCNFKLSTYYNDGTYIGCHRYDQSALNIILAKNFGLSVWDKVGNMKVTRRLVYVARYLEGKYAVNTFPHCNHTEVLHGIAGSHHCL